MNNFYFPPLPQNDRIAWPADIRPPSANDLCALALIRKLDILAFYTAGLLGTLRIGTHRGQVAWLITDMAGAAAEARRLDGTLWEGGLKSLALPGSTKNAPVGLRTHNLYLDKLADIVLVEGAPDYYAALQIAVNCNVNFRVCAMLGAGCSIQDAPPRLSEAPGSAFKGARVIIIPHNDQAGQRASERWSRQLYGLGAQKVWRQPLPAEFKDLNEYVTANPAPSQGALLLERFSNAPGSACPGDAL